MPDHQPGQPGLFDRRVTWNILLLALLVALFCTIGGYAYLRTTIAALAEQELASELQDETQVRERHQSFRDLQAMLQRIEERQQFVDAELIAQRLHTPRLGVVWREASSADRREQLWLDHLQIRSGDMQLQLNTNAEHASAARDFAAALNGARIEESADGASRFEITWPFLDPGR